MIVQRKAGRVSFIIGEIKVCIEIFFCGVWPLTICIWLQNVSVLIKNISLGIGFVMMFFGNKIVSYNCLVKAYLRTKRNGGPPVFISFFGKDLYHSICTLCAI